MKTQISIGNKIAKLRRQKGLSQKDLANLLGYKSASTLSKIESGENDLTITTLEKIALCLGVDMASLMTKENDPASPIGVDSLQEVLFKRRNKVFSFCVGGILFNEEGVLLIEDGKDFTVPTANLRIGESVLNCLKRLFKDKLGLNIELDRHLASLEYDRKSGDEDISTFYLFFLVRKKGRKAFVKPKEKMSSHFFLPFEKIGDISIKPEFLRKIIECVDGNPKWLWIAEK
ncbi:MAG: helix-turn-helix domain-containing protein [Bacilli bacterium]|nr:helix-turn-helix domain-containing protein [Bacilli bacterium]